jgi:superfamily II DNA or RNA helicase
MRLIASVKLSEEDANAINQGLGPDKVLEDALSRDLVELRNLGDKSRLEALAWLVAQGLLEIKVAIPIRKGEVQPCGPGRNELFHSKVGIFIDPSGDSLSFSGSINETAMGWTGHNEQFHVHASWKDPDGHVKSDIAYFEKHWENRTTRARVYAFPDAVRQKLITYARAEPPTREPEETAKTPVVSPSEPKKDIVLLDFIRHAPLLANGEALTETFAPFKPRPHQLAVANAVTRAFPRRFLLADEVGLGKTIETGLVLKRLLLTGRIRRCLILTPWSIVKQWQEELSEKFNLNFSRYDGQRLWDVHGHEVEPSTNPLNANDLVLTSMNLMRRQERQVELLSAKPWDLVILDEAHHARRSNIMWGGHGPNLLLRLMQELKDRTVGLLLLTATPMQLHLLELYDTLALLGTRGRWATDEDAFVAFFGSLAALKHGLADYHLLFDMVREYYKEGGTVDNEFAKDVKDRIGISAWDRIRRVQDASNPAKAVERLSPEEVPYLQEYVSRSTPLHSLMFRNTRSLFKRYREMGLPGERFPDRDVEDIFINLKEPEERALYDKIEEYVTHFYRKAEARNNFILKLVMQGFRRRLTSSLGAIRKSLINRLSIIEASGIATAGLADEDLEDPDIDIDGPFKREEDLHEEADLIAEESEFLRQFIVEVEAFRQDSKLDRFLTDLSQLLNTHERIIVFTQFTDTMDYVREHLSLLYGSKVACYSGRGGEIFDARSRNWKPISKEVLKQEFKKSSSQIKILLGTEALSEGLNLQAASAIVNYDMPWNPMRVEQRIGRIDRIGQTADRISVRNYFYRGTIEDQIYHVLGERHTLFREVVGEAPAILAMIHEAIKEGVTVPEDERVAWIRKKREQLREEFKRLREDRIILENMAAPASRVKDIHEAPITPEELETFFTNSILTHHLLSKQGPGVYHLSFPQNALITFDSKTADERIESVTYLSYGSSLLRELLAALPTADVVPKTQARIIKVTSRGAREGAAFFCHLAAGVLEVKTFHQLSILIDEEKNLLLFSAKDLTETESILNTRIMTEIDHEEEALRTYETGKLKNLRAECGQILNGLVAIELAKRRLLSGSWEERGATEAKGILRRLLQTRVDRVPALAEAAGVDIEHYTLPHEVATKYADKSKDFLDGSRGPLVKSADSTLGAVRILSDRIAPPHERPALEIKTEGLL